MSGLEGERLERVRSLEARLAGVDEGARALATHTAETVASLYQKRIEVLDSSLASTTADKRDTIAAQEQRCAALENALEVSPSKPAYVSLFQSGAAFPSLTRSSSNRVCSDEARGQEDRGGAH